jgi:TnpA family transposase
MNEKSYQHINDIFTSKEPNWQLIESMYYDMLRVIMSIQSGKIKASTINRTIANIINKLYIFELIII